MSDTQHPYEHMIKRLEERLARAEVRLAKLESKAGRASDEAIIPDAPHVVKKAGK